MFRHNAKPPYHLRTVGRIDSANGHYWYKEEYQEDYSQRLRHPVVKREVLVHTLILIPKSYLIVA